CSACREWSAPGTREGREAGRARSPRFPWSGGGGFRYVVTCAAGGPRRSCVFREPGAHGSDGDGVADWVTSTVETMGYAGVAVLMFLENLFPPLPSEVIMPFAGFAAARGELTYVGVVIAG